MAVSTDAKILSREKREMWLILWYQRLFVVVPFPSQVWAIQHFLHSFLARYTTCIKLKVKRTFFALILVGTSFFATTCARRNFRAAASYCGASTNYAGKINEVLFRGAQPKESGLAGLKKLGITTVVDLRGEDREKYEWERKEAESLGMRFVHLAVSGWAPPSDEQAAQFLALFRDDPHLRVFDIAASGTTAPAFWWPLTAWR